MVMQVREINSIISFENKVVSEAISNYNSLVTMMIEYVKSNFNELDSKRLENSLVKAPLKVKLDSVLMSIRSGKALSKVEFNNLMSNYNQVVSGLVRSYVETRLGCENRSYDKEYAIFLYNTIYASHKVSKK